MAKEVIERLACDPCQQDQRADRYNVAFSFDLTLMGGQKIHHDICQEHADSMRLAELLEAVAVEPVFFPASPKAKRKRTPPPKVMQRCDVAGCGFSSTSTQGFANHRIRKHGINDKQQLDKAKSAAQTNGSVPPVEVGVP